MKNQFSNLAEFLATLSTTDEAALMADDIKRISQYIQSDGCTGVPEFYHAECVKHDFYYRTHVDFAGMAITKSVADKRFRKGIQRKSWLGVLSPMSWWRWLGVQFPAAQRAWEN